MEPSNTLKNFIKDSAWTFAKTYAKTWPHEYIVQEKVDNNLFLQLAKHIDDNGKKEYFYSMQMIYYEYNNKVYWHMENIINRCELSETYTRRKEEGRLP